MALCINSLSQTLLSHCCLPLLLLLLSRSLSSPSAHCLLLVRSRVL
jgi:hypothetical protein